MIVLCPLVGCGCVSSVPCPLVAEAECTISELYPLFVIVVPYVSRFAVVVCVTSVLCPW
jgi:hypothetical protein